MAFEAYYTIEEICRRIPRSATFYRRAIQRGEFSPGRTPDEQPDLSNILQIDGTYFVPASGIAHYLDAHRMRSAALVELMTERERPEPEDRPEPGEPIAARSAGELRRKLAHG